MNRELSMEVGKKKQRCYKERKGEQRFLEKKKKKRKRKKGMKMEGGKGGWFARKKFESQLRELIFFFPLSPVRSLVHENKKKRKKRKGKNDGK